MILESLEYNVQLEKSKRIAELKHRKEVNPLKYHVSMPMQQRFSEDIAKFKCIFGANRSGKSEEAIKYAINKMLQKPRQKWWICGETFQDSIAIQQTKAAKLVPKHRVRYGRFDVINGYTNRKLLLDNGSLAIFKSYDQSREAFQGDDLDGILNDEEPPFDVFKEQQMRLIDRDGEMIISMTSLNGVTDLIANIYQDCDVIESQYAPLVKKILPRIAEKDGIKFYFLWSEENKHINQNRLMQQAKLMPPDEKLCRLYGVPINLSGKIYISFNKNIHVNEIEDIPDIGNQLYNVLDPHDRKPWAIGWFLANKNESCYMIDEYPNRNFNEMLFDDKTYSDYATIIKDKEAAIRRMFKINGPTKRIIDPNFGNKTVQLAERQGGQAKTTPRKELEKLGLKYNDGIDALEAGHLEVRKWLHWVKKDNQIIVQPKIFIISNCQNTITHLSRYSLKDINAADGDVKDRVAPQDKYKDFCFVAGTLIRMADGTQRPIENILVGDVVQTDIGPRIVLKAKPTRISETIKCIFSDGRELIGTPNHNVYLENGNKIALGNLRYGDIMMTWNIRTNIDIFPDEYGKNSMVKYQKDSIFIILITMLKTMKFIILNAYYKKSIWNYLGKKESLEKSSVKYVAKCLKQKMQRMKRDFVPIIVNQKQGEIQESITKKESALSVIKNSKLTNIAKQELAQLRVVEFLRAVPNGEKLVYNLTVADRHRYYANDILVANCDVTRYFVMSNPRYIEHKEFKPSTKKTY